jgi:hypothetical protein
MFPKTAARAPRQTVTPDMPGQRQPDQAPKRMFSTIQGLMQRMWWFALAISRRHRVVSWLLAQSAGDARGRACRIARADVVCSSPAGLALAPGMPGVPD